MCESCSSPSHAGRRRWTSTHLLVLGLITTLAVLAAVGLAMRLQGGGSNGAAGCGRAAGDSIAYQAAITRDLHGGARLLLADTSQYVLKVRASGASTCSQVQKLVSTTTATLDTVCTLCSERLRRGLLVSPT